MQRGFISFTHTHTPQPPTFNPPSYPGLQLLAEERFSMEEKMGVCLRAMTA